MKMPRNILRKNIADEMLRDHAYSRGELWMFYGNVSGTEHYIRNYSTMESGSFERFLREWTGYGELVKTLVPVTKTLKDGSFRTDYIIKYSLVSQDAGPCFCQRNVDRFRRALGWLNSQIKRKKS